MQINDKFFSFPPFLSVAWAHVSAISISPERHLVFFLNSGEAIPLPPIPEETMDLIFKAHANYLENQVLTDPFTKSRHLFLPKEKSDHPESSIQFAFGSMDGFGTNMQHNPAQQNAPDLPEEMLAKIAEVSKILAPSDPSQLPKPEPHCNCPHCQIARALHQAANKDPEESEEEEIPLTELEFQQWEITKTGDKLYLVANKLDQLENYSVHLGQPIGCTCGKQNCEHILAVLKT